jgi:hypothetical protein
MELWERFEALATLDGLLRDTATGGLVGPLVDELSARRSCVAGWS